MVNILHLNGSPREIGYKHGALARSQIAACLANYGVYFANAGMAPAEVKDLASKFLATIQAQAPHIAEEIAGIAEGAGVDVLDIVSLNARSEIALSASPDKVAATPPVDGCTTFAERAGDRQWLAQNWDWQTSQLSNLVVLEIDSGSGKQLKTVTEAGLVAKVGLNNRGVGVCLNALRATDLDTAKLPLHVLLRLVLESDSVAGFVAAHADGAAGYGHFGCADAAGAVSLEIGPYGIYQIPQNAARKLYHTNHALADGIKINEVIWLEDTKARLARMHELTAASPAALAGPAEQRDRIFGFLSDEDNYPNSICRSNDEAQKGLLGEMQTVFSIVMDLTARTASVRVGRPKYTLEAIELAF
ncbi:acyl-coenzyme A:6-aminopenicillanic acid acyl-transferase-domain-containing protein [Dipodascopsis tothii]|uniref:acyl-coenzyme A:6-aminopenicillanic acid acyl-transferase-domain-containing protein n=1 Tax=Dipodascopsis tothii TaxID=44089 RepID=UPI0034CE82BE